MHFEEFDSRFAIGALFKSRFSPPTVRTASSQNENEGPGVCVSRRRPLWGNIAKAVAHPRAQQQRTVLLKLFLGPQEVVQLRYAAPASNPNDTHFVSGKGDWVQHQQTKAGRRILHSPPRVLVYAAAELEEYTLGQQRPQPTVDVHSRPWTVDSL